jgi:hypothetical protein
MGSVLGLGWDRNQNTSSQVQGSNNANRGAKESQT